MPLELDEKAVVEYPPPRACPGCRTSVEGAPQVVLGSMQEAHETSACVAPGRVENEAMGALTERVRRIGRDPSTVEAAYLGRCVLARKAAFARARQNWSPSALAADRVPPDAADRCRTD
jgi:hypothetical protein